MKYMTFIHDHIERLVVVALVLVALVSGLTAVGCENGSQSVQPPTKTYNVYVYSGGSLIRMYRVTKIDMAWSNNRAHFTNEETGKEVRVMGEIVVEEQ